MSSTGDDWTRMEDAPADGTLILLFEGPEPDSQFVGFSDDGDMWWDRGIDRLLKPTSWRHLPAPPATIARN